jgi:predicted phosphodiesterase
MRLITISDIHGNIEAFKSVIEDVINTYGNNIDAFLFLGDYGCDFLYGEECVNLMHQLEQKYKLYVISGNRETDMVQNYQKMKEENNITWSLDTTMGAPLLSCNRMSDETIKYLSELPNELIVEMEGTTPIYMTHKMPLTKDKIAELRQMGVKDILTGHTHEFQNQKYEDFHLMNAGSVGLTDNGIKGADYGVVTWKNNNWQFEEKHIDYDYDKMIELVKENDILINRCKGWGKALIASIETGLNCCVLYMKFRDNIAESYEKKMNSKVSFGDGRYGNVSPTGEALKDQVFLGQAENLPQIKEVYFESDDLKPIKKTTLKIEDWMYEEALKQMIEYVYDLKEKGSLQGQILNERRK